MAIFIGTDEAGYGPNLGPLVVTATAWDGPDEWDPEWLYERLENCICRKPDHPEDPRVAIADSKELYQPGGGLRLLERGVATALHACGTPASTWRAAWEKLAGINSDGLDGVPWHAGYDPPLPLDCLADDITAAAGQLANGLAQHGMQLKGVRSAALFPAEFNSRIEQCGNKSTLLSRCTLELVREVVLQFPSVPVVVSCDKHGGRNYYQPLLQEVFPEYLVEVRRESADLSVYRWGPRSARVEFRFAAKGERFLAAALASMVSKYLRELAMRAFNDFWLREVPGLRATAGYPTDAHRFKRDIAERQQSLGIPDAVLWRCR